MITGRAFDLKIYEGEEQKRYVFSVNNFKEACDISRSFLADWEKVEGKAEWTRTVPDSVFGGDKVQTARLIERKWKRNTSDEKGVYSSNKKLRSKIDKRLAKIAALEAQRGCQSTEEEISKKIAVLKQEISSLDAEFLKGEE